MSNKTPTNISDALRKLFSIRYTTRIAVSRSYDIWYFRQVKADWKRRQMIKVQKLNYESHAKLGSDQAVSRFVVSKCKGAVRNHQGNWISKVKDLPPEYSKVFKVTAIKVRGTNLLTEGIDNFVGLDYLESLDLSANYGLDDFACDQLARQFRASRTLREIDLSHNFRISIYGLEVLFRIPSIRKITAIGTQAAEHREIDLFTLAAEDERQCEIIVHEGNRRFKLPELESTRKETLQLAD